MAFKTLSRPPLFFAQQEEMLLIFLVCDQMLWRHDSWPLLQQPWRPAYLIVKWRQHIEVEFNIWNIVETPGVCLPLCLSIINVEVNLINLDWDFHDSINKL